MKRSAAIPKGATGIYRLDCSSSPPRFDDNTPLTVVKKGPPGHCIVRNAAGVEQIIRDSELVLDAKWGMYQVGRPSESPVKISGMMSDVNF